MNLYIRDLILEVTRRCNMICRHCMRGNMQPIDMSTKVVDRLLDSVESIGSVTFTGGEPLLNVPLIRYFTDQVQERKIPLSSFFVVTNGKKVDMEFVHCLIDLYSYVDDEEGMCGLEMSQDQFHEDVEVPKIYKALKFFHPDARKEDYRRDSIVNSGLARLNRIGSKVSREGSFSFNDYNEDTLNPEMVYIAANGNVIHDCDYSYYHIDKYAAGNMLKTPLLDILMSKREEVEA